MNSLTLKKIGTMIKNFVEYCKKREGDLVNGKLDNDDLICFEDMQKYWDDYVKLFIPRVSNSYSKNDLQVAFEQARCNKHSFKDWYEFNYCYAKYMISGVFKPIT